MITIRKERPPDAVAREALLDEAFGTRRWRKNSQRLRDGRVPADGLAFVATEGKEIVGTARLWTISYGGGRTALLLGPLAVSASRRRRGIGAALLRHAVETARRLGHNAIVLIGDAAYYGRFGFSSEKTAGLRMSGPYEPHRLLALELKPGALDGARGLLRPASKAAPSAAAASAA